MGGVGNLYTNVEISLSCIDLCSSDHLVSKINPMVVVYLNMDGPDDWKEVDRTESVKNSMSPDFIKKIILEYRFEEQQRLKFAIFDVDVRATELTEKDFLGGCEATLGEIVSSHRIHRKLCGGSHKNNGTLIICAEEMSTCRDEITFEFYGRNLDRKDVFGTSDPFLMFYKVNEDRSRTLVHRTEFIKNNLNPHWQPFTIPTRHLCNGDYDRPIVITCVDWNKSGKEVLIGETAITVNSLRGGPVTDRLSWPLVHPKKSRRKNYANSGFLFLNAVRLEKVPTFVEYVQGGTEFCCCIAIDFTASNGCPSVPGTLHYCTNDKMSQYAVALQAVGEIIADYDSDNMFPAFGFGAHVPSINSVSHSFPLNGLPENPYCQGIAGVMQAYHHSLRTVNLHGPTNFAPIINKVANIARQNEDGSQYYILLILTDGIICDMPLTKSAIVNASMLPLSIIIVGVGAADFEAMEELDGDEIRLAFRGRYAERDIVQFVPLRDFHDVPSLAATKRELAKAVLAEIPDQLVSFMRAKGIKPGKFLTKSTDENNTDENDEPGTPGPFADRPMLKKLAASPEEKRNSFREQKTMPNGAPPTITNHTTNEQRRPTLYEEQFEEVRQRTLASVLANGEAQYAI